MGEGQEREPSLRKRHVLVNGRLQGSWVLSGMVTCLTNRLENSFFFGCFLGFWQGEGEGEEEGGEKGVLEGEGEVKGGEGGRGLFGGDRQFWECFSE